jgi:UDP-N-acetylmuramoyl-L-alanyl-D-glutamate--2,6-diaminopimelate ligase
LLALGASLQFEPDLARASNALAAAAAAPGRMEVFGGGGGRPWVIVDYAHTPDALERVLAELGRLDANEIHCVFGCGGDRDPGKREPMGRIAAQGSDHLVLTDDNPRSEDPAAITAAIARGAAGHASVLIEHDRETAIRRAIDAAAVGDVVLIAGKGHETVQIADTERRLFDDRAVVRAALGAAVSEGAS